MSSLLDVPAQLALVLSLAASTVANEPPAARPAAEPPPPHRVTLAPDPLEGPFAFGEGVWLKALKDGPAHAAAPGYAQRIFKTSGGRYYVPASDARKAILAMRFDAAFAEHVARALALDDGRALKSLLQRAPSAGELYIAHIVGSDEAARFIALAAAKPGEDAGRHFAGLAGAVPAARGAPLTLAQLYARLCQRVKEQAADAQPSLQQPEPPSFRPAPSFKPTTSFKPTMGAAGRTQAMAWRVEVSRPRWSAPAPLQ